MVYMFLALEGEILANSSLCFTGSGRPHNKLDLDWKILADIRLPLVTCTQQAEQTFLVFYASPFATYYEKRRPSAPGLFSRCGSMLRPCTGHAEHARESVFPEASPPATDGAAVDKVPAPSPLGWNDSEECVLRSLAAVTCLIMDPTWAPALPCLTPPPLSASVSLGSSPNHRLVCKSVSAQESLQSHKSTVKAIS